MTEQKQEKQQSTTKQTTVQWFQNPYSLNEISQQTGFLFAFLSAPRHGLKQLHPWAKCRDFLHDAVKCAFTKTSCTIYGFKFDGNKDMLDLRRMRMLVTKIGLKKGQPEQAFVKKIISSLRLVNHYEKMAGVSLTKVKKVYENDRPVWIFNGPAFWLKAPVLVSMYTFLIRLGDKELEFEGDADLVAKLEKLTKEYQKSDNDVTYLKAMYWRLGKIVANAEELLFMGEKVDPLYFEKGVNISTFHDRSGILNFCQGNIPTSNAKRKQLIVKTLKKEV